MIVDRKQRGHVFELRHAAMFDLQIRRDEPGLPIVGVDHVELQAQQADASITAREKNTNRSQLSR